MIPRISLPQLSWLCFFASVIGQCMIQQHGLLATDVAWHVEVARKLLQGQQLYSDIFEVNFPAIYWYRVPFLLLADTIGISVSQVVIYGQIVLAALSCLLCRYVAYHAHGDCPNKVAITWMVTQLVLLWLFAGHFGQKEHLFLVFALPYLMTLTYRHAKLGRVYCMALAAFGALGVIIKPFYVVFWAVAQCFSWVSVYKRTGKIKLIRSDLMVMVLCLSVYGVWLWYYYAEHYLLQIQLIANAYIHYRAQSDARFWNVFLWQFLPIIGVLWPLAWMKALRDGSTFIRFTAIATIMAAFVAWMQAKAWDYHVYFVVAFALFSYIPALEAIRRRLSLILNDSQARLKLNDSLNLILLFSVLGSIMFIGGLQRHDMLKKAQYHEYIRQVSAHVDEFDSAHVPQLMVLGNIDDGFPLAERLPVRWASNLSHPWVYEAGDKATPYMHEVTSRIFAARADMLIINQKFMPYVERYLPRLLLDYDFVADVSKGEAVLHLYQVKSLE